MMTVFSSTSVKPTVQTTSKPFHLAHAIALFVAVIVLHDDNFTMSKHLQRATRKAKTRKQNSKTKKKQQLKIDTSTTYSRLWCAENVKSSHIKRIYSVNEKVKIEIILGCNWAIHHRHHHQQRDSFVFVKCLMLC